EVIGVHWFQYADEPRGGRDDGEDYNFGLVDIDDRPYELLTPALAAENLARLAEPPGKVTDPVVPAAMHEVPRAVIDAADQSLAEWPKSSAILPLRPAPGEAVFGNALLTWSERGLSVAVLAMDYY